MGKEPVLCLRSTVDLQSGRFGMLGEEPVLCDAAQWIHLPLAARSRAVMAGSYLALLAKEGPCLCCAP